jgi:hypothetical protein
MKNNQEFFIAILIIIIFVFINYLQPIQMKYFDQKISKQDPILEDVLIDNNFNKENKSVLRQKLNKINADNIDLVLANLKNLNNLSTNTKDIVNKRQSIFNDTIIKPSVLTLSDEHKIIKKYRLWELFSQNLDQNNLNNLLPETYNLLSAKDIQKINQTSPYENNPQFILKSENSQINSTYVSNNDMSDFISQINNRNKFYIRQFSERINNYQLLNSLRYTIAQKFVSNQLTINKHLFKVKCYLLITRYNQETNGYLYKNGHIYYAKEKFNPLQINTSNTIASRKNMNFNRSKEQVKSIYRNMPKSIIQWKEYLEKNNMDFNLPLNNLVELNKVICHVCALNLGNSLISIDNESFGLYEVDVFFKDDNKPLLLKINNVKPFDNPSPIESKIRRNVWNDTLEKANLIQDKDGLNGMKLIYSSN